MNRKHSEVDGGLFCFLYLRLAANRLCTHSRNDLPRSFVLALVALVLASFLALTFGILIAGVRRLEPSPQHAPSVGSGTERQTGRLPMVRLWKAMIVVLIISLFTGLIKAKEFPAWEILVAVGLNLAMTAMLIWAVIQLRKTIKRGVR